MRAFLLVHGGMHGGWCWKRVRRLIAKAGHDVVAPTLTGLGHRSHLGAADVDLQTHITDVLHCIDCEEMEDFVLVGHSYAGMVITGVADRIPDRIAHLVYLDALVPTDGESAADIVPRGVDYGIFADGMLPVIPGYDFGLTEPEDIAWVRRRTTPQSVRTVTQRLSVSTDLSRLRRWFIECVAQREGHIQMVGIAKRAHRIASDPTWSHLVLNAGHDCMISHPVETAEILMRIAREPSQHPL